MSLLSLLAVLAAFQGTTLSNQGVIAGKITQLDGTGRVSGVQVLLVGPATGPGLNAIISNPLMAAEIAEGASFPQVTITTGDDGRFSFKNLAPGLYTIRAKRDGYFGASMPGSPPTSTLTTTSVTVVAGQTNPEVSLALAHGVTISGQVRDPNGQPMPNVTVAAFQMKYSDGRPALGATLSKTTDDRGEYRLFWLPPGEYYVGVTPPRPSSTDGRPQAYARTFYPAATDTRTAQRLTVMDGVDLSATDISVQALNTVKVSGQVVNALPGAPAQSGLPSMFYLMPRDSTALTDVTVLNLFNERSNRTAQFELRGVPLGSYDLVTTAPDSRGSSFPGRARIEVGPQDLENVTIAIRPGAEVRARVIFNGQPVAALPPATQQVAGAALVFSATGDRQASSFQQSSAPGLVDRGSAAPAIRLQLRSKESYPAPFDSAAAMNASIDAAGAIIFPNVPESIYAVHVSGSVPENAYVADIREDGVSIYDSGLAVTTASPGLIDVIVSSGGSTIKGTVRDAADKALANAVIVLVPPASRRQNPVLYKNVRSSNDGSFTITAVPPGEYKLFAWHSVFSVPATAYMNAEFMSKYEARGQSVSVAAGATPPFVLLTVLPAD